MNETLLFLAVGILLIAVLLFLLRETGKRSPEELPDAAESPWLESWSSEVGQRILGHSDWDYVYESASPEVRRLFCAERRQLALSWLYQVRRSTQALMREHRIRSSKSERILISLECRLLLDYFALRTSCEFAIFMVLLANPPALRQTVRWAGGVTNRFHNLAQSALRVNALLNSEKHT